MVRLKPLCAGKTLLDRGFYRIDKILRRNRILKLDINIVYDFIEVIFKERQDTQLIMLSVHESVPLLV